MTATAAIVLAAALAGTATVLAYVSRAHNHIVEHIDRQIYFLRRVITVSAQDTVNAAVAQVKKGTGEVVNLVAELKAQIAAAGVADQVDLTALTEAAQALDDIVPDAVEVPEDAPVEVPADDAPAEVVGDEPSDATA